MSDSVLFSIPTERQEVVLRQLAPPDAQAFFNAYDASRREMDQFVLGGALSFLTPAAVEDFIIESGMVGRLLFGIWDRDTLVGSAELSSIKEGAEIGYWRGSRFKHQGYATIAARALTAWAAEDFPVVRARVIKGNRRSIKVLERIGYQPVRSYEPGILAFEFKSARH